jgi:hypothetical protein
MYPRFDNPLNPDIMLPSVGDVVDSVKCAVTGYLLDRTSKLQGEAQHRLHSEMHLNGGRNVDTTFCNPAEDWLKPTRWRFVLINPIEDKQTGKTECKPFRSYHPGERVPDANEWPGLTKCANPYRAYKYVTLVKNPNAAKSGRQYRCEPIGGCEPGTYPTKAGACGMDDRSRFALDPNSNARIDLTLTAVNSGSMNYTKLDAERLDLRSFVVPGGANSPFPMFKGTDKNKNTVQLTVSMPQNSLKAESLDATARKTIQAFEQARKDRLKEADPWAELRKRFLEGGLSDRPSQELFTEKAYAVLLEDHQEFKKRCGLLRVDFLGLQRYVARMVEDQEQRIHGGAPNVAMETMVLTSEFQLQFDASAGTHGVLRILPVLTPPTLGLNTDHTHNLKITFTGPKARALANYTFALTQKCVERVTGAGVDPTVRPEEFCRTPQAIQLESLIDAVENRPAGG